MMTKSSDTYVPPGNNGVKKIFTWSYFYDLVMLVVNS